MIPKAPNIDQIKLTYLIPAAWRDLQLEGAPGKSVCSPFRPERNPSFSVHDDGRRWHDFGTDESGDVLDFVARALGGDLKSALAWIHERLGFVSHPAEIATNDSAKRKKRQVPELRFSTLEERKALNERRGFSLESIRLAEARGFLRFCTFAGVTAWCVKDKRDRLYELRRLDGQPWSAYKHLPERKSHCFGTGKHWPIGVLEASNHKTCALVEGAPDFLALFTFIVAEGKEDSVAPLAMLGAASAQIAPEALTSWTGKHIRLFPHLDAAGNRAAVAWARQLVGAGCRVDAFDVSGCLCVDGQFGKDLADVCRIAPDCWERERKFHAMLP